MTPSHLALPKEEHLNQLWHMLAQLKKCHSDELVLDPSDPALGTSEFEQRVWVSS